MRLVSRRGIFNSRQWYKVGTTRLSTHACTHIRTTANHDYSSRNDKHFTHTVQQTFAKSERIKTRYIRHVKLIKKSTLYLVAGRFYDADYLSRSRCESLVTSTVIASGCYREIYPGNLFWQFNVKGELQIISYNITIWRMLN